MNRNVFLCAVVPWLGILVFGQERLRLPFQPTVAMLQSGEFSVSESHRFAGSIAPIGEPNLFRHALGMDQFGNTAMELSAGIWSNVLGSLAWESRLQSAEVGTKISALRQNRYRLPISLVLSANLAMRNRGVEKGDRYSAGGSLTLQRSLFDNHWMLAVSALGQSHTNLEILSVQPRHSFAVGMGIIRQGTSITTFGDVLFPLHQGGYGYRNTYGARAPDGIPPMAFGAGFQLWRGILDVLITNTTSMQYANFLAGADAPTALRMMEWRLGLGYRYGFGIGIGKGGKAWTD